MAIPLNALMLEKTAADVDVVVQELRQTGFMPTVKRVDTEKDFLACLDSAVDVILANEQLSACPVLTVLRSLKQQNRDIPVIVLAEPGRDREAAECMRHGAADYLFKDRLARLGPAVGRALENKNIRGAYRRAELHQSIGYVISQALMSSTTVEEIIHKIMQALCDTLQWEWSGVWLVDRQTNTLRCMTIWHMPSIKLPEFEAATRQITFAPDVGLPGRVWSSGKPAYIPDVLQDPAFPRKAAAEKEGIHGAFAFPIMYGGNLIGVMEFFSRAVRYPEPAVLDLFTTIGSQIGQQIEHQSLEDQLHQSMKMDAIGRLAGGVAHDFNNMLTVITGYAQAIVERLSPHDPLAQNVLEIKKAGERSAALTRQLLAFSRRQVLQPRVINLNATITNIESMLRRLIGEDIELRASLNPTLGSVRADPGQIEQVILNLVVNARDAMPEGGKLTIETSNIELDHSYAQRHLPVKPGPYVMMAVSDTGSGMDAQTQKHIFEPFFTTKELGKGTGLGLSTVYGIIKQSSGYIWVYSEQGKGTTFKVYLPRSNARPETLEPDLPASPIRGFETVLLVEDEEGVRTLLRSVLQSCGYTVLEAAHSKEALFQAGRHDGEIHLMVTDVVMPGMSGRELAERLQSAHPGMKVLFISGYTDNAIVHHGVLDPGRHFLGKPFTPETLTRKVREVLDNRP